MSIILALVVFSAIILFHEFGHFLLAKLNGITVTEFALGMGPRLLHFEKGGTVYCLKLLPFGGSCMMLGEDEGDGGDGTFGSKNVWQRISVIAAGPVFNFILAFILSMIVVANVGYDQPVVMAVAEGFGAEKVGIQPGDTILSIGGTTTHLAREVTNFVTFHQKRMSSGDPLEVTFVHEGEKKTVSLIPQDNGSGRYVMGISTNPYYRTPANVWTTVKYGVYEIGYWIKTTYDSLGMLLTGGVSVNEMSGPVGVVSMIGETVNESKPDGVFFIFLNLINIGIMLNANLGVMNLLPLPALDGGRLVFLVIEVFRRKRIDPDTEGKIHLAGLLALLLFSVLIMANDVRKLIP